MYFGTKTRLREKARNDERYNYCIDFLRKKGLNQSDVARKLGLANALVSEFMNGRNNIKSLLGFFELLD